MGYIFSCYCTRYHQLSRSVIAKMLETEDAPSSMPPKKPQTVAENVQSSDDVLSLDDLQQRQRSLSKRVAQTHRCADLVWFEIRHLQKTFDIMDVVILDELDYGSCVIASQGGGVTLLSTERLGE